jgi:hypothetical protein
VSRPRHTVIEFVFEHDDRRVLVVGHYTPEYIPYDRDVQPDPPEFDVTALRNPDTGAPCLMATWRELVDDDAVFTKIFAAAEREYEQRRHEDD